MHKQWLEHIQALCARAGLTCIDVIVDHAGWDQSVLPALRVLRPIAPWSSLFTGTPEEQLLAHAPIVMRLSLNEPGHKAWLEEMLRALGDTSRLMLLLSPLPFADLAPMLRGLSRFEWGSRGGLLRYFDSRVFATLLSTVLSETQKEQFLQLGLFWGWVDCDLQLVWERGSYTSTADPQPFNAPIVLNDEQFNCLGCISDAYKVRLVARDIWPQLSIEQCFQRCYDLALRASREGYLGDLQEYLSQIHVDTLLRRGVDDAW